MIKIVYIIFFSVTILDEFALCVFINDGSFLIFFVFTDSVHHVEIVGECSMFSLEDDDMEP